MFADPADLFDTRLPVNSGNSTVWARKAVRAGGVTFSNFLRGRARRGAPGTSDHPFTSVRWALGVGARAGGQRGAERKKEEGRRGEEEKRERERGEQAGGCVTRPSGPREGRSALAGRGDLALPGGSAPTFQVAAGG